MEKNRDTLVLYTTAVCNLNCRYCYIDKNPALKHIDDILDNSFKGEYYFDFIKKMFPHSGQLKKLETWGGEPFLRMDRLYNTLHKIIDYYPFLNTLFSSTNFSFENWNEQFFGLMNELGKYPERPFYYNLQLSLDGPKYINDFNRGKGTTEKCLKNFDLLVKNLEENKLPSNVYLRINFKPTLDLESTKKVCSKEKIIDYYQFFEKLVEKIWNLNLDNVSISLPVPNTACPSPVTKKDGEIFCKLCQLCNEIEKENIDKKYLLYYQVITPFKIDMDNSVTDLSYNYPQYTCGMGYSTVGLLPHNLISTCHSGFVDLLSEYKNLCTANKGHSSIDFETFLLDHPSKLSLTKKEYIEFEKQISYYYNDNTTARLINIVSMINILAYTNQIDSKYKDKKEALRAGIFIQNHTAYCIRDNYNCTGSISLVPVGILKLLLNGAKEYIETPNYNKIEEVC